MTARNLQAQLNSSQKHTACRYSGHIQPCLWPVDSFCFSICSKRNSSGRVKALASSCLEEEHAFPSCRAHWIRHSPFTFPSFLGERWVWVHSGPCTELQSHLWSFVPRQGLAVAQRNLNSFCDSGSSPMCSPTWFSLPR